MKQTTKLFFAIVSTMLLLVGATRAAEKFDPMSNSVGAVQSAAMTEPPSWPCGNTEEN